MADPLVQDLYMAAKTLSLEDQRELNRLIVGLINDHHDQKNRQAAATLKVGDTVQFQGRKRGLPITGTIVGFTQKYVKVDAYQDKYGYPTAIVVHWTCPPAGLTKVAGPAPKPAAPRSATISRLVNDLKNLQNGRTTEVITSKDVGVLEFGPNGELKIK